MSNVEDQFEDEANEQATKNPVRARMREMETEIRALKEKAAEAVNLQRELAFSKAGIPMEAPMAKYFVKAYDGEITPEAIRQAAEEANLIQSQTPAASTHEQQAWMRLQKSSAAGDTSEPLIDWNVRLAQAKNSDEVMQILAQVRAETQT